MDQPLKTAKQGIYPGCSREETLAFLLLNKIAYMDAFAGISEDIYDYGQWTAYYGDGQMKSLLAIFDRIRPATVFALGHITGLKLLRQEAGFPSAIQILTSREFIKYLESDFILETPVMMQQMYLFKKKKRPRLQGQAARLGIADLSDIQELFAACSCGVFQDIYQLMNGVYFGIRKEEHLVSLCGTHVFAPEHGMASIGNVMTHPLYRRQSYGAQCLDRLIYELSKQCPNICIKVSTDNDVALHMYQKAGFIRCQEFFEGKVISKKGIKDV